MPKDHPNHARGSNRGRPIDTARHNMLRYVLAHGGPNAELLSANGQGISSAMSDALGYKSPTACTSLALEVQRAGLIERTINGRRLYRFALTDAGRALARSLPPWGAPDGSASVAALEDRQRSADLVPALTIEAPAEADDVEPIDAAPEPSAEAYALADAPLTMPAEDGRDALWRQAEAYLGAEPAPVISLRPVPAMVEPDLDAHAVALALLDLVLTRAHAPAADASAAEHEREAEAMRRELAPTRERLAAVLADNERMRRQVRDLGDELRARAEEVRGLRLKLATVESNLAKQLELNAHTVTIGERNRRELDRLIRERPRQKAM